MTDAAQEVLKHALCLKPIERVELIEHLLKSFDVAKDDRVDALWAEEAESRIHAYDAGKLGEDTAGAVYRCQE